MLQRMVRYQPKISDGKEQLTHGYVKLIIEICVQTSGLIGIIHFCVESADPVVAQGFVSNEERQRGSAGYSADVPSNVLTSSIYRSGKTKSPVACTPKTLVAAAWPLCSPFHTPENPLRCGGVCLWS